MSDDDDYGASLPRFKGAGEVFARSLERMQRERDQATDKVEALQAQIAALESNQRAMSEGLVDTCNRYASLLDDCRELLMTGLYPDDINAMIHRIEDALMAQSTEQKR